MKKNHESVYFTLELVDGIVHFSHKPGTIGLGEAIKIVEERLELFEGASYPLLITGEGIADISKEARDYLVSEKGTEGILAGALLGTSAYSYFFANFLIQVSNPPIPVKKFREKEKALAWLSKYLPSKSKTQVKYESQI